MKNHIKELNEMIHISKNEIQEITKILLKLPEIEITQKQKTLNSAKRKVKLWLAENTEDKEVMMKLIELLDSLQEELNEYYKAKNRFKKVKKINYER